MACLHQATNILEVVLAKKKSDPDVFWTSERTENCKQRQWCNVHNVAFAGIQTDHDDSNICASHTVHKHMVSFSELLSTKSDSLAAHFLCGNPAANNNFKSSTKPPDRGMEASWGSRFEAATSPLTPWQELPPTWKWIMGTPLFFPWDASLNLRGTNWLMWAHLLQLVMLWFSLLILSDNQRLSSNCCITLQECMYQANLLKVPILLNWKSYFEMPMWLPWFTGIVTPGLWNSNPDVRSPNSHASRIITK